MIGSQHYMLWAYFFGVTKMPMLHTIQTSYVHLRSSEVTAGESPLDSTTLWELTSQDCFELDPAFNGICMYFAGEATDGAKSTAHIWGRDGAGNGPAEKIAEISLTFGSGYFFGKLPKTTTAYEGSAYAMVDTITLDTTNELHVRDIDFFDDGNNRQCKLTFDTTGLKFVLVEFTQAGAANQPTRITPYARFW